MIILKCAKDEQTTLEIETYRILSYCSSDLQHSSNNSIISAGIQYYISRHTAVPRRCIDGGSVIAKLGRLFDYLLLSVSKTVSVDYVSVSVRGGTSSDDDMVR